jgi:aminopeptidase N
MHADRLTRAEAAERGHLISDVSYDVELDLTGPADSFASTTLVRFHCAEPGASTFLDLDALEVTTLTLNAAPLALEAFSGSRVVLTDLAAENEVRVVARCAYQHTGVGMHRFTDPVDGNTYLHTQFEPFDAHRVYACFDQPDLKASFALGVLAPAGWQVISNAPALRSGDRDGEGDGPAHWRFRPTLPISTYVTAVVAGSYEVVRDRHRDIDLGFYCRRSLASYLDTDEIIELTRQGLDFYEQLFDYPYPFGKYDQLFVPEFNFGAMENAGCVTFSESFVFRSKVTDASRQSRASTILHEMAHMWFGDLVTMRWWDDLWLNESFATYMATYALAEATRFTNAWASFANNTKAWAYRQDQLPSTHPIAADIVDTDAVRTNFDGITYAKGASVLRQLVAWVGNDAFVQGLHVYFRRHAFANATLADFLSVLEEASGRQLDRWSKQWLETAGVSTLRAQVESHHGRYVDVALTQEAPDRTRCCARTGSPSGCTHSRTGPSACGTESSWTSSARARASRSSPARRSPTCCSSTTTT